MNRQTPGRPDFFIVGAPKSGTTALYDYLRQHPDVFMSPAKEPNYFGTDLVRLRTPRPSLEQYLAYFADAGDERRVGEASVRYLHSRSAAAEIRDFAPDAQAIIMLRDPVEMMFAMHAELLFSGAEDIADFGEALDAEPDRMQGRRIPPGANKPAALYYRQSACFAEQVQRYFQALGRENVHVIIYDDFRDDPLAAYQSVLRFLGVEGGFVPDMKVVNANKRPRSRLMQRIVSNPPGWVRRVAAVTLPPAMRRRAYRHAMALNARTEARQPMDPQLRAALRAEFADEVRRLGELLGRDLSGWSA